MTKCKWCGKNFDGWGNYCSKKCEAEAKAANVPEGGSGCLNWLKYPFIIAIVLIIIVAVYKGEKDKASGNSVTQKTEINELKDSSIVKTEENNNTNLSDNSVEKAEQKYDEKNDDSDYFSENDIVVDDICYRNYSNARFKYSIPYPKDFNIGEPSENGDGRVFSDKNAELRVSGSVTGSDFDIKELFEHSKELEKEKNNQVTYEQLGKEWFVLSGSDENGKIYYQKTLHNNKADITATLTYDESEKEYYEKMIKYIFNNLKLTE